MLMSAGVIIACGSRVVLLEETSNIEDVVGTRDIGTHCLRTYKHKRGVLHAHFFSVSAL